MSAGISAFEVKGVPTTIGFHHDVLSQGDFAEGLVNTRWVEEKFLNSGKH